MGRVRLHRQGRRDGRLCDGPGDIVGPPLIRIGHGQLALLLGRVQRLRGHGHHGGGIWIGRRVFSLMANRFHHGHDGVIECGRNVSRRTAWQVDRDGLVGLGTRQAMVINGHQLSSTVMKCTREEALRVAGLCSCSSRSATVTSVVFFARRLIKQNSFGLMLGPTPLDSTRLPDAGTRDRSSRHWDQRDALLAYDYLGWFGRSPVPGT